MEPASNEFYTKLYVFQIEEGNKATKGSYRWGQNGSLFFNIQQINVLADQLFKIDGNPIFSDLSSLKLFKEKKILSWQLMFGGDKYLFITTLNLKKNPYKFDLNGYPAAELIFEHGDNLKTEENNRSLLLTSYSYAIFRL